MNRMMIELDTWKKDYLSKTAFIYWIMNTPDIMFDGIVWEMKSPTGGGKYTIKHTVQNAKHQSSNVIVDLRRCKLQDEHAIRELKHHFELSKRLRRMKIITKSENILDYTK